MTLRPHTDHTLWWVLTFQTWTFSGINCPMNWCGYFYATWFQRKKSPLSAEFYFESIKYPRRRTIMMILCWSNEYDSLKQSNSQKNIQNCSFCIWNCRLSGVYIYICFSTNNTHLFKDTPNIFWERVLSVYCTLIFSSFSFVPSSLSSSSSYVRKFTKSCGTKLLCI